MRAALRQVLGQTEFEGTGVIGIVGVATAATYNTTTGVGSVTRVDASNQSFVQFPVIIGKVYRLDISAGSPAALVRDGSQSGSTIQTIDNTRSLVRFVPTSNTLTITSSGLTANITVHSLKA